MIGLLYYYFGPHNGQRVAEESHDLSDQNNTESTQQETLMKENECDSEESDVEEEDCTTDDAATSKRKVIHK